jgi:hypothetical protein
MVTIFSLPKPFRGAIDEIQRNAVRSWKALGPDVQIILLGDETGIADAAGREGVEHIPNVARSASGTPRLDDAFERVDRIARHRLRLFVNADIVLNPDVLLAARTVARQFPTSLLAGQTRDLPVMPALLEDPEQLRTAALGGTPRGPAAIDWFLFPAGLFDPMPPFAVGRAGFDNWMIWRARQRGKVVDATAAVAAIHQPHSYDHLEGGFAEAYYGAEAEENLRLGGGKRRRYTLHDATHRLTVDLELRRNLGAVLRVRETARKAAWKLSTARPQRAGTSQTR